MMRSILRFPILFLGLTALFVLALTLAFAIPNQAVEWHQEYSMVVLDIEEKWESLGNRYGLFGVPGMPDNSADRSMIRRTIVAENAVIGAGAIVGGEEGNIAVVGQGITIPAGATVPAGQQVDESYSF